MKTLLARQIINTDNKSIDFETIKIITPKEFDEINKNLIEIDLYFQIEDYFKIIQKNYEELTEYLNKEFIEIHENDLPMFFDDFFAKEIRIEINRKLLNYLSSVRTFIDHMNRILKDKNLQEDLEKYVNKIYDNNFSYRFYSRLRNYAQHSGLPLTYFIYEFNKLNVKKVLYTFDIKHLLTDFGSWSTVKKDLLEFGDKKLDCAVVSSKYQENINSINNFILEITKPNLQNSVQCLKKILQKLKLSDKIVIITEISQDVFTAKHISQEKLKILEEKGY